MPIVDASDPVSWSNAYQIGYPKNRRVWLNYDRAVMLPIARRHAEGLVGALRLVDGQSIGLTGGGFGWTAEELAKLLPNARIITTDTSSWVHAKKDLPATDNYRAAITAAGLDPYSGEGAALLAEMDDGGPMARVTILDESLSDNASRNRIWGAAGGTLDWAISEEVLPWLADNECVALDIWMQQIASNVAHLLTPYMASKAEEPEPPPIYNWKYPTSPNGGVVQKMWDQPWYTVDNWKALLPNSPIVTVGSFKVF